jgi:hypothetical protein
MFASIKKLAKFGKYFCYNKKSEKVFDKLTLGNSEFVISKNFQSQKFDKPYNNANFVDWSKSLVRLRRVTVSSTKAKVDLTFYFRSTWLHSSNYLFMRKSVCVCLCLCLCPWLWLWLCGCGQALFRCKRIKFQSNLLLPSKLFFPVNFFGIFEKF